MPNLEGLVSVRIITRSDGEEFVTLADGRISRHGNDYRVLFSEKTANGVIYSNLLIAEEIAQIRRRGAANCEMVFDRSCKTHGTYSSGGLATDFDVETSRYDVAYSDGKIVVNLEYYLLGGGIGRFELEITISERDMSH